MSTPQPPRPAKLVLGIFLQNKGLLALLAGELETAFGPLDLVSAWMPFDYTPYYTNEMGAPLFRRMFAFRSLIAQERLPEIKMATNAMEQTLAVDGRRQVNIDPGYLLSERFVLATGKNYSHRIYIGQGIYADLTLIYRHGSFQPLPWTYPDFADQPLRRFLGAVRSRYALDLKTEPFATRNRSDAEDDQKHDRLCRRCRQLRQPDGFG